MKINFTNSVFTKTIYCSLLASGILLSHSLWATDDDPDASKKKKKEPAVTTRYSLNNKSIKLYPDVFKREMHVIVKEKDETDFLVLDAEGTLVLNRKMKEGEHFKIAGLERGFYTYHVFSGEEEKATGKFEIR